METISKKPLIVKTGKFTGRSPEDRYFVRTAQNKDIIDWGERNISISENTFEKLFIQLESYLTQQINFEYIGNVISDSQHSYEVSILTEEKWYAQFAKNIFRDDRFKIFLNKIKILHAPSFLPKDYDDLKSKNFIIIHPEKKIILIAGTGYAGEIKKSVFSLLNIDMINKNILPMHCSANYDEKNTTTLYFGLSGTGKTTLSSDSAKQLIGDDEHGWSNSGVFNIEGGCYAKVAGLDKNKEPEIFKSTMHPSTIIENVVCDDKNNINFNDTSITENTRSCYSLDTIDNIYKQSLAPHPKNIIMLSCDAFGVLPPVSKLSVDQAVYQFISGYTAKIPGTETDIKEPVATFSPCFGGPFMPRFIQDYAKLFRERIEEFNSQCWLINSGWWGGPYGVGKRIDLRITRQILNHCINNAFDEKSFVTSEVLNLVFPKYIKIDQKINLNPLDKWHDIKEYKFAAKKLNKLFDNNMQSLIYK